MDTQLVMPSDYGMCETRARDQSCGNMAGGLIQPEEQWQIDPARAMPSARRGPCISLARWTAAPRGNSLELVSDDAYDMHFIGYWLRRTEGSYWSVTEDFTAGVVFPGSVFLQGPTYQRRRGVITTPTDVFRVYIPQGLLAECAEAVTGQYPSGEVALFEPHFVDDKVITNFVKCLINVDDDGGAAGPAFVDEVGLALATYIIGRYLNRTGRCRENRPLQLPKWRLKRVLEYVDANLGGPICLADLSGAAGLSRMHFAAQFRAATGYTPHMYVIHRRIAMAQTLLADRNLAIGTISSMTGFRTQAHFTSVFGKITGQSPAQWRRSLELF